MHFFQFCFHEPRLVSQWIMVILISNGCCNSYHKQQRFIISQSRCQKYKISISRLKSVSQAIFFPKALEKTCFYSFPSGSCQKSLPLFTSPPLPLSYVMALRAPLDNAGLSPHLRTFNHICKDPFSK